MFELRNVTKMTEYSEQLVVIVLSMQYVRELMYLIIEYDHLRNGS